MPIPYQNPQQKPLVPLVVIESALRGTTGLGSGQAPANVSWYRSFRDNSAARVTRARRSHRETEIRWRESHVDALRRYSGEWVVLEGERIVTHGHDLSRVISDARAAGIAAPYVFLVEVEAPDVVPIGL